MALIDLTKKIHADAAQQSDRIIAEANARAKKTQEETTAKSELARASFEAEMKNNIEESEKRITASAYKENKAALEKAKRELLDKVFEGALATLEELDKDAYTQKLFSLFECVPHENTITVIHAPKNRITETREAAKKAVFALDVIADENITGGAIMKGDRFEYDLTFKTVIDGKKRESESHIAEILFL